MLACFPYPTLTRVFSYCQKKCPDVNNWARQPLSWVAQVRSAMESVERMERAAGIGGATGTSGNVPRGTGPEIFPSILAVTLFVTGKYPVMTGKHAQITGFSRHLAGKIHLQSNDGKNPSFAAMLIPVKNMGFFPSPPTNVQSLWVPRGFRHLFLTGKCPEIACWGKHAKIADHLTGRRIHVQSLWVPIFFFHLPSKDPLFVGGDNRNYLLFFFKFFSRTFVGGDNRKRHLSR